MKIQIKILTSLTLAAVSQILFLWPPGPSGDSRGAQEIAKPVALTDASIAPYQVQLLSIASDAASSFPLVPHVKNRSRAQAQVIGAFLKLDQPERARHLISSVEGWRRGMGYADLAYYAAEHGVTEEVRSLVKLAREVANAGEEVIEQAWRRERILARAAQALFLIGDQKAALPPKNELQKDLAAGVSLGLDRKLPAKQCLDALEQSFQAGDLEDVRRMLTQCVELHARLYERQAERELIEKKLRASWTKLPRQVAIEFVLQLALTAVEHGDQAMGLEWVEEAQGFVDAAHWIPEDGIKFAAHIGALRHLAGDETRARSQVQSARSEYSKQRNKIVDIWRARTLRPLAEAYHALGDRAGTLETYRLAIDEGLSNPNSRPRCDDLVATCVSLAIHEVKPGQQILARLNEIAMGLGKPW